MKKEREREDIRNEWRIQEKERTKEKMKDIRKRRKYIRDKLRMKEKERI